MSRRQRPIRLDVPPDTAAAVRRGHPWVFRDRPYAAPTGAVVELVDPQGATAGWGLADEGPIAVRVLGRGAPPEGGLQGLLVERVLRADRARQRLVAPETDAYRVLAGAGDALEGLVLDRYGELAVLRVYAAAWEPHLPAVVAAVQRLGWAGSLWRRLGVARVDAGEGGVPLWGPAPPEVLVVEEHGMRMLVRPHVGQKTGLFLDQREHRALVRRFAAGSRVANLFGYTGGFSVAAALGGAARVVTVDLAPEAIADARENFRLNGLDPDAHGFEVADAFRWRPQGTLDLLVLDPPSLARGKRSEAAARRAYRKLHADLGGTVARDGLLATSSCTSRLGLDPWRQAVAEGLGGTGDWSWHLVSAEPPDHPVALGHPEGRYLKFGLLRRL